MFRGRYSPIWPDGGVAALPKFFVDLSNASCTGFPTSAFAGLKSAGSRFPRLCLNPCLRISPTNTLVDFGCCRPAHLIGDMDVNVQCGAAGHMADDSGECFDIHSMLQCGGGKGVPKLMQAEEGE